MSLSAEAAETFALKALAWLAENDELLPVFLGATGASLDDLKLQTTDPTFLGSVLDFLTMDDAWVVAMCDALNEEYATPLIARQSLPGGAQMNWT